MHIQPVIEQVIELIELLCSSHLLKSPNGESPRAGSQTRVVVLIARKHACFSRGISHGCSPVAIDAIAFRDRHSLLAPWVDTPMDIGPPVMSPVDSVMPPVDV